MSLLAQHGCMIGGSSRDPHYANVVSLLNFMGADGATSTTDPFRPWSFFGNAKIVTAVHGNGHSSLLLDGSGDYIQTPNATVLQVGRSIFTMEIVFRVNEIGRTQVLASRRPPSGAFEFYWWVNGSNRLNFAAYGSTGGALLEMLSPVDIPTGRFVHAAIVRNGTQWYHFMDGQLVASGTPSGSLVSDNQPLMIGRMAPFPGTRDFNGWIGGWRRTDGVARWTSDFSPPRLPFPEE